MVASAATARTVLQAAAEGRDGKIYLLVVRPWEGGGFALDRYDPIARVIERVPLHFEERSWLTLAAGKEGLYLASFLPQRGPWILSWEEIEEAVWQRVKNVHIDSFSIEDDDTEERGSNGGTAGPWARRAERRPTAPPRFAATLQACLPIPAFRD